MIPLRHLVLACAGSLLLVPFAGAAQPAAQPETAAPDTATPAPEGEEAKDAAVQDEAPADSKRICRSVRADPSSRRKTRVCRTSEEWRELNVPL